MRLICVAFGLALGLACLAQAQTLPVQQLLLLSSAAFDPATTAWVNAVVTAGGSVSGAQKATVNKLVVCLRTNGLFSLLDRYWIHAAENVQQATVDLIHDASLSNTGGGGMAFNTSPNNGFQANGTNWADLNFTPSVNGVNYQLNSATAASYTISNITVAQSAATIGVDDASNHALQLLPNFSPSTLFAINTDNGGSTTVTTSRGFDVASRTGSTTTNEYIFKSAGDGGNTSSSDATASNALPTISTFLGARNNNGTADLKSSYILAATILGGGVSSGQATSLSTCTNNYMTAVGVNVY